MASQSLYRKWRSQTFAEIVGQQRVTRTLQNAFLTKRLSHAYLFCGPRGVGKTSAARVLAKAVNCHNSQDGEPCNSCSICLSINEGRCLDIIEIDAASNRGIDEIRDLREKVNFAPSEASYKFYILDEVHMLTAEAFNALLKTLEEPPSHAVFVLVTTESHRLPATILSRCQRFDFHRISLPDLTGRLRFICEAEGIKIEESAVEAIGRLATGSLRDAESLLDQMVSYCGSEITLADVHMVVGMTGSKAAAELAEHLVAGDVPSGLRLINKLAGEGADLRQFGREVVEHLRGMLVLKVGGGSDLLDVPDEVLRAMQGLAEKASVETLIRAIRLFTNAEASQRSALHIQMPIELAFVEATLLPGKSDAATQPYPSAVTRNRPAPQAMAEERKIAPRPAAFPRSQAASAQAEKTENVVPRSVQQVEITEPVAEQETGAEPGPVAATDLTRVLRGHWSKVIEKCGHSNKSIQAILRDCEVLGVEDGIATLEFPFKFHKDTIEDPKNGAIVASILGELLGSPVRLKCSIRPADKKRSVKSPVDDPVVKAAVEFGARIKKIEVTRRDTS